MTEYSTVSQQQDSSRFDALTLAEIAELEDLERAGTIRDHDRAALTSARARLAPVGGGLAHCAARLAFVGDTIAAGVAAARRRHATGRPTAARCARAGRRRPGRSRSFTRRTGATRAGPDDDPGEPVAHAARGDRA